MAQTVVSAVRDVLGLAGGRNKRLCIDSLTFQIYNRVTTGLLLLTSVVATARQIFGEPIKCDAGASGNGVRSEVLEAYCWMYAHFKIPPEYQGPCSGTTQALSFDGPIYNTYYQWVPIYLIFLSVLFYLPRCLWLMMEGGLIKFFCKGTTTRMIEDPEEKRDKLVAFFRANIHNKYNIYYYGFIFCEILNISMAVVAVFLTHRFLNYHFLGYGFKVWYYYNLPEEERHMEGVINPMCEAFPRIASCTYYRYGGGGRQESINAICILSLNVINDKVFLILWWWLLFLLFIGIGRTLFRCIQVYSVRLRYNLLRYRLHRFFKRNENLDKVRSYIYTCSRGDWFILYQLSKNLNRPFFMDFLVTLSRVIEQDSLRSKGTELDLGDGIMDMMLKPNFSVGDELVEKKKKGDDDEDDDDDGDKDD